MHTVFKLQPTQTKHELDVARFRSSLPSGFAVEEREDGVYVTVETLAAEDSRAQYFIDRELDRLFFLTRVRYNAEMCRESLYADVRISFDAYVQMPAAAPLHWTYEIALQLRLWSVASGVSDPFSKILLLYQVIELSYPDKSQYPSYPSALTAPHPLTECKFLRHLVAHAGIASSEELKRYCDYLAIPNWMLDRTDPSQMAIIASKLKLVEEQARRCLSVAA